MAALLAEEDEEQKKKKGGEGAEVKAGGKSSKSKKRKKKKGGAAGDAKNEGKGDERIEETETMPEEVEELNAAMTRGVSLAAESMGAEASRAVKGRQEENDKHEEQVQGSIGAEEEDEEQNDEEEFLLDGAPEDYKCPISFKLMTDPIVAPDGHVSLDDIAYKSSQFLIIRPSFLPFAIRRMPGKHCKAILIIQCSVSTKKK